MIYRWWRIFLCVFLITLSFFSPPGMAAKKIGLSAKSAIIMDKNREKVLYKKNPHLRMPVASTAKILTAIIVVERLNLKENVIVSKRAAGISPSKVYLTENAAYEVEDLLKALLMSSANDAGVALAEAVSGSEVEFVKLMNGRAKSLGARNSFFLNATGLPEGGKRQYSTVYDLALIMREALTYPQLEAIMKTKRAAINRKEGDKICIRNHNKFLWRKDNTLIGKTGYTRKARHCFLGIFYKGRRKLIVAILGSRNVWPDLDYLMAKRY